MQDVASLGNVITLSRARRLRNFCSLYTLCESTNHKIWFPRADINILLCGDPGTSKSQLLQVSLVSAI